MRLPELIPTSQSVDVFDSYAKSASPHHELTVASLEDARRAPHMSGAFYHVMLRGNVRQAIFRDEEDRDALEKCLTDALDYYCAEIHAYCWMTNHLHPLLRVSLAYCDAKWRTVLNTGSSVQVNYVSRKQVIYVQETLAITSTRLTHITCAA